MIRALAIAVMFAGLVDGCTCAGVPGGPFDQAASGSPAEGSGLGSSTPTAAPPGLNLPRGVGPASGGGKCTAPVTSKADVQERPGGSLEERTFGTRTGEVSVRETQEPCP